MSKPLKSIEMQKQDIVKYTSYFQGTKVYDQPEPNWVRVDCPNHIVLEVLLNYFQSQGLHVDTVVIGHQTKDYSFMIKLLPPAIDSEALVAMMRDYLQSLNDTGKTEVYDTYRNLAANELQDFLTYLGIQAKDL